MDALICIDPRMQFKEPAIERELGKVMSAIQKRPDEPDTLRFVTGKWGCGRLLGDKRIKFLVQYLACCAVGRDILLVAGTP